MPKARKPVKAHIERVGSVRDRPMYERVMHWKPHIEEIYRILGYGEVTVMPTQEAIDEWNELQAQNRA